MTGIRLDHHPRPVRVTLQLCPHDGSEAKSCHLTVRIDPDGITVGVATWLLAAGPTCAWGPLRSQ